MFINYELKGMPVTADGYRGAAERCPPPIPAVMAHYPSRSTRRRGQARPQPEPAPRSAHSTNPRRCTAKVPTFAACSRTTRSRRRSPNTDADHGCRSRQRHPVRLPEPRHPSSPSPSPFTSPAASRVELVTDYWAKFMATGNGFSRRSRCTVPDGRERVIYGTGATTVDSSNFEQAHQCSGSARRAQASASLRRLGEVRPYESRSLIGRSRNRDRRGAIWVIFTLEIARLGASRGQTSADR